MTASDREAFATMLFVLGETFNEPVSQLRLEGYFEALRDLAWEAVQGAGQRALRECRFFPKPAELREFVTGRVEDQAALAWCALRRLVASVGFYGQPTFEDASVERAMHEVFGSWKRCCELLQLEGPAATDQQRNFQLAYRALAARQLLPAGPDVVRFPEARPELPAGSGFRQVSK